jgi:hypothetical protein
MSKLALAWLFALGAAIGAPAAAQSPNNDVREVRTHDADTGRQAKVGKTTKPAKSTKKPKSALAKKRRAAK